jgi:hypothetical protein
MSHDRFTTQDLTRLAERGISPEDAREQLERLNRPPEYVRLVRPCTVGDGIEVLDDDRVAELHDVHARATREGRFSKFVPASGAASRMFRELVWFRSAEDAPADLAAARRLAEERPGGEAAVLVTVLDNLRRFAFREDLEWLFRARGEDLWALVEDGRYHELLDGMLGRHGLNYAGLPKGLLKFHDYPDGARTPFEEHLVEAAGHARDGGDRCRLQFTVSPDHRDAFRQRLAEVRDRLQQRLGVKFDVEWSEQDPSTDTLAADADGEPVRDADGGLVFRPGGHGALIRNLSRLDGDVVYLKNIDNVQPDRVKPTTIAWKRALGGLLVELQQRAAESIDRLRHAGRDALESALSPVGRVLHISLNGRPDRDAARDEILRRLNRPLRVCGVVRNTGEPGGGPFWVRERNGLVTVQIVESAQVDPDEDEQQAIFRSSTHFNPVDLVCGLKDPQGQPYDLERFVDHDAVIVTRKSVDGSHITALERPGLWNGAMAGWNTVFVEVPLETFSPVKSVVDLLRPEHQPA